MLIRALTSALFTAAFLTSVANAAIIINTDQSASGSLGTINLPGANTTGTTIQGVANSGALLNITGTESLISPSGGQARVEAVDAAFTNLTLSFANGNLFDRIVFNLDAAADGNVTITAFDQFLNPTQTVIALNSNGQNFINVASTGTTDIARVTFTSAVAIENIAQIRVDNLPGTGISTTAVPEPATFGVVGAGLLGLGLIVRRRRPA